MFWEREVAVRTFDTLRQKVVRPYIALPAAPLPTALLSALRATHGLLIIYTVHI